jgi:CDP-diacylglycerol--glycerol-3-phosphate 3-phosphatidyltransferase
VLDITADRIVEHIFWISFAVFGQVGLWVPLVIMTRSFLVDAARGMALVHGKTPFGSSTLQRSALTRFLTGSRTMRTGYAVAKTAAFVLMGTEVALARAEAVGLTPLSTNASDLLGVGAHVSVWVAVVLCVVRGIPVLMDSRAYLEPAPDGSAAGGGA